jgi:hypothetical protein
MRPLPHPGSSRTGGPPAPLAGAVHHRTPARRGPPLSRAPEPLGTEADGSPAALIQIGDRFVNKVHPPDLEPHS